MDSSTWLNRNIGRLRTVSALVLLLSLVVLGVYLTWFLVSIPAGQPPLPEDFELRDLLAFVPMLVSCFTALISLATFLVSTLAIAARHQREKTLAELDIQKRKLEIELARRELDKEE